MRACRGTGVALSPVDIFLWIYIIERPLLGRSATTTSIRRLVKEGKNKNKVDIRKMSPEGRVLAFRKVTIVQSRIWSSAYCIVSTMFDLAPHPSAPVVATTTHKSFRLGKERGLPPHLVGEQSQYLVEVTGDDDPANAKSWAFSKKMQTAAVLGFGTLVASWGSSVYSAAVQPVAIEFGVSEIVSILGLTLYICGFATGELNILPRRSANTHNKCRSIVLRTNIWALWAKDSNHRRMLCLHMFYVRRCYRQGFPDVDVMSIFCRHVCIM